MRAAFLAEFRHRGEFIAGIRLTPKGVFRWHASCCKMPLGNTLGRAIPFVGSSMARRDPMTCSASRSGLSTANMRLATSRQVRQGSICGFSRAHRRILGWRLRGLHLPTRASALQRHRHVEYTAELAKTNAPPTFASGLTSTLSCPPGCFVLLKTSPRFHDIDEADTSDRA